MDNAKEAHELAMVLLSLAAANNLSVKQYAFSRIEEILVRQMVELRGFYKRLGSYKCYK